MSSAFRSRRLLAPLGVAASALALLAAPACKKKQVEEVKKKILKKIEITEVPLPENAVGELVVRDPETFMRKLSTGAGLEPILGASPYQKLVDSVADDSAKKAIKAIDPHGTIAGVGLFKFGNPAEKPHGVVAARLKDPDIAAAALDAAEKSGQSIKAWDSGVLGGKVYELKDGGEVAVYGDVVILADTREAIDGAGKYVAWRAAKSTVDHELVLRVPMERIGPELKKLGVAEWAKVKPGDVPPKVKAELDPLVEPVLGGVADMGQTLVTFDIDGDNLKIDETFAAKASLSEWLKKYPTGDATPLLTMPKAESVSLQRFPDGLGPLAYALLEWSVDGTTLSAADRAEVGKQARALGKALGHSFAYATDTVKGAAPAPGAPPSLDTEIFVRFDLDDPAAVKGAIPALRKLVEKSMGTGKKLTAAPYKKHGAEGETLTTAAIIPGFGPTSATATKDTWVWALKGSELFVDLCLGCTPHLLDAALDPAAKGTLADDPLAKAKVGEFPTKDLISASYGTTLSLPGLAGGMGSFMGAPPSPKKPGAAMWGWSTVAPTGITAKGAVPLAFVGDVSKSLIAIAGMGMMGGGMGGPPPF